MASDGSINKIFDGDKFREIEHRTYDVMRGYEQTLSDDGVDWKAFRLQMKRVLETLKQKFENEGTDQASRYHHYLRLADGKGLWIGLKQKFGFSKTTQNHVLNVLRSGQYADEFRLNLGELVGTKIPATN